MIKIIPSKKSLGATVLGVDFSSNLCADEINVIHEAWTKYLVLHFPNQTLTEKQHIDVASIFGSIHISAAKAYCTKENDNKVIKSIYPEISIVHNLDSNGNPAKDNRSLGSAEVLWHSDNSYVEIPPSASLLYALEIPSKGGETFFSNQYLAYDKLPLEIKKLINGCTTVHDSSRDNAQVVRSGMSLPKNIYDVPGPHHPLVRVHPVSKKKALFLGRKRDYPSQYIDGFREEESEEILNFLWKHANKEEFVWRHKWTKGDLILWDNRCTMHYRSAFPENEKRIMHRVMVKGEPVLMAKEV